MSEQVDATEVRDDRAPGKKGCGSIAGGSVLVLIGIPMLVCPGPGIAAIGTGAAMIAAGLGIRPKSLRRGA